MTVRRRFVPGTVGLVVALGVALSGCGTASSGIVVSGTVDASLTTVTAPTFRTPAVNLDAGFSDLTGPRDPVTGRTANKSSTAAALLSVGSTVRVAQVLVAQGESVTAGQALVTLDTSAQKAQLAAATADRQAVAAAVGALDDAIDTTYDKESDLRDAKAKVLDAISKVRSGIHTVTKKMAQGRKQLANAKRTLAQIEAQIAALPPGVPVPPALAELRDKLLAGIKAGTAGLKKAGAVLKKLRKGLKTARTGLAKINDGFAKIADARTTLRGRRSVAAAQARVLQVPVDLARTQLALAALVSPVDGFVVSIAAVGEQLAPGATVVGIRERRPSKVTAWLSPSQLDQVCSGDAARITGDWMSGSGVPARLTRITTSADYPPTSVATEEVHLTRAVEVDFTATEQLPAGVPVEISIQGCRPAAGTTTDPNR